MQLSISPVFKVWLDPAWVNIVRIVLILSVGWILDILGILEVIALFFLVSLVWKSLTLAVGDEITWTELVQIYDIGAGHPAPIFCLKQ